MGQANHRGTYEERVAQAKARVTEEEIKLTKTYLNALPRKVVRRNVPLAVLLAVEALNTNK